jgi:hypothetical protein
LQKIEQLRNRKAAPLGRQPEVIHCQQVKKGVGAFLAQERQKPGFPLQFLAPLRGLRDFRFNPLRRAETHNAASALPQGAAYKAAAVICAEQIAYNEFSGLPENSGLSAARNLSRPVAAHGLTLCLNLLTVEN